MLKTPRLKEPNILKKVQKYLHEGNYRDTRHASQRGVERNIYLPDILEVLKNGYHEKRKDEYREDFKSWNYAIRGKTLDGDELRIVVYFESQRMMIATVIRLN